MRLVRSIGPSPAIVPSASIIDVERAPVEPNGTLFGAHPWVKSVLRRCAKPVLAVALGAQLFFGALAPVSAQGSMIGASRPVETTIVVQQQQQQGGEARALRERAAYQLSVLDTAKRELDAARQALPLARNAVRVLEEQLASAGVLRAELIAKVGGLETRLAAEQDPVERVILGEELAPVKTELAGVSKTAGEVAVKLASARREATSASRTVRAAERKFSAAERELRAELEQAKRMLASLGVETLPWIIHDRSLQALGLETSGTEAERVINFAARVEAWVEHYGALPGGDVLARLAITRNAGLDWALANLPPGVVIPAEHVPFVASFDVDMGLRGAKELASRLGRSTLEVRDLVMFARHPVSEHAALIDRIVALDRASGGIAGPLSAFEPYWSRDLLALAEQAREHGLPFSAEAIPFLELGTKGAHAHQRENVAWMLRNARFEGAPGEYQSALDWAEFSRPERGALDRLATRLGHRLTVAEIIVASRLGDRIDTIGLDLGPGEHALKDLYLRSQTADRASLLERVKSRLGETVDRADREYTESFDAAAPKLTTVELQKISLIQDALQRSDVKTELARLVREDLRSGTTEVGGRVLLDPQGRAFLAASDGSGHGNNAFRAGAELNPLDALLSFHLHALDRRGDPGAAGPSSGLGGDLGTARALQLDGIVITLVAKDCVNVDFYTAGGVVLDLGTINLR